MVTPKEKGISYRNWSRLLAGAIVLFPYSIYKVDFRAAVSGGLTISTNQASPAYAAFQDSREHYRTEIPKVKETTQVLTAGLQRYQMPAREVQPRIRQLAMRGMTIRNMAPATPQPFYVAGQNVLRSGVSRPDMAHIDRLNMRERQLQLATDIQDKDWAIPTAASRARELAQQDLDRQNQKVIRSSTGTSITVAGHPDVAVVDSVPNDGRSWSANLSTVTPDPNQLRPLWLHGYIEMTGGLAFMGSQTSLNIRRVYEGQSLESGRIWVTEGKFEIHVKKAVGTLVAELVTRDGRILGRGELNLLQLKEIPRRENRIADIRIALQPIAQGATFRATSGHSHGQHVLPVKTARVEIQNHSDAQVVNDEGIVSESSITHDSTFVARASAKKHWASLVIGQAEKPQEIRLFPDSMIEALVGLQFNNFMDQKEALKSSVVWGQLTENGQSKAGVQVEMAGNYLPIYFNEMYLPDPKLKATSANGLFAFLNVRRGVQALRVKANGRMYPAQIFPTEEKHVSYVGIEIANRLVTQFKVMDMMDLRRQIPATIRMVGTDRVTEIRGTNYVEYDSGANPIMVEADAGMEFEISRVTLSGRPQQVSIPLIRREWLREIYNQSQAITLPGRGIVVGFVDDQDFEVEMTGYNRAESPQIMYFDADGKVIKSRTGVAGGGFIIFNAPNGLQTVFVHPLQSRESFSQVVVAEPDFVHVLTY